MKMLSYRIFLSATMFACFGFATASFASAETVRVMASTSFTNQLLVPHQDEIEKKTGHRLQIETSRVDVGLFALFDGKADVVMIAAPINDVVMQLKETKPELPFERLRSSLISETRVAYAVNPNNPVRSVTQAKLRQILAGQIDNWRALGGPDLRIRIVSLSGASGTRLTTQRVILAGQPITARSEIRVANPEDVAKVVSEDPGSLGIAQAAIVSSHHLPELQMESPVRQQFYAVSLGESTEAVRSVIVAIRRLSYEENP